MERTGKCCSDSVIPNSLAVGSTVTQEFWVRILADPKDFRLGITSLVAAVGFGRCASIYPGIFLKPWSLASSAALRSQFWSPAHRESRTWPRRYSTLLAYGTLEFASSSTSGPAVLTSSPLAVAFSTSLIISPFNSETLS